MVNPWHKYETATTRKKQALLSLLAGLTFFSVLYMVTTVFQIPLCPIKSFFGIKSPSRVFRDEVGAMLAEGMAAGIEENADAPLDAMTDLSSDLLDEAEGLNGLTLERKLNNTFTNSAADNATSGLLGKLDSILAAIERGQVIAIDGKQLIGATAAGYDSTLGQRRALVERGAQ
jgi:hypothetical protein